MLVGATVWIFITEALPAAAFPPNLFGHLLYVAGFAACALALLAAINYVRRR
jgi:hypothetical protein